VGFADETFELGEGQGSEIFNRDPAIARKVRRGERYYFSFKRIINFGDWMVGTTRLVPTFASFGMFE